MIFYFFNCFAYPMNMLKIPVPWDWLFLWWTVFCIIWGSWIFKSIVPFSYFESFVGRILDEWYIRWSFVPCSNTFLYAFSAYAWLRFFWLPLVSLILSNLGKDYYEVIGVFVFIVFWLGTVWRVWWGYCTYWWGCLTLNLEFLIIALELVFFMEFDPWEL